MKKTSLFLQFIIISTFLNAQVKFEAVEFSPQYPKASQTIRFKYNSQLSALINENNVGVAIYLFSNKGITVIEPILSKSGQLYSGQFTLDSTSSCVAFSFTSDKKKDINGGGGYIIPVYTTKNEPTEKYFNNASVLYSGYGEYLFGMDINDAKALEILEEGQKLYPQIKYERSNFNNYLQFLNAVKKSEAKTLIATELVKYEEKGSLTEDDYNLLIDWYNKDKQKSKADSFSAAMKVNFPYGEWNRTEAEKKFFNEKEVEKKISLYNEYLKKYSDNENNKRTLNNMRWQIANTYARSKKYKLFEEWNNLLDEPTAASNLNYTARNMAEDGKHIREAKKMSWRATSYAKNNLDNLKLAKPDFLTKKQWESERKSTYALYADTYAYILYKLGDYKKGYSYSKEAAGIKSNKNAEYNEHYAMLIEKVLPTGDAQKKLEEFVKNGTATSKTKEILKTLCSKLNISDKGFDDYLVDLEMAAKIKKTEELTKTMVSEAAPNFSLKDIDGNIVSLDGLKGKVVIVDFWATWCGPCIASMPAMKKAQEKYKNRNDVKFVFINTLESDGNKLQNAVDFMKKNNYPFHVLMDDENKMVADFKVSGIPATFIIDKKGTIRFKSDGFGGNDEELVDEIEIMIDLVVK